MAAQNTDSPPAAPAPAVPAGGAGDAASGGAYEVLRARLTEHCAALRERVEKLNSARRDVFGGHDTKLVASARIATENSCIPRDIVHLGRKLIFGYEVFIGLRKETSVNDVFSVYEFDGQDFKSLGADFLQDPAFVRDFKDIFQYYKNARLLQLHNTGTHLLFVIQAGALPTDCKVLRWAMQRDGSVKYVDNRGDKEHVFPPQHDFEWKRTTREQHVPGRSPHISIEEQVFVECIGGDLTVRIENNTQDGQGIYSEPVENADQSLDDAEIYYAILENLVLLKIRPFGEENFRYLVYSKLREQVRRIDSIGSACVQLPEGHGIIFPGGYFLQTGEWKQFDEDIADMEFFKAIRSLNGEDVLYLFYHRVDGRYILLLYNLVRKELNPPIACNGYSLYDDGRLVVFRNTGNEAGRSHPVQIWQTPFVGEAFEQANRPDSYIGRIGNKELVRGISELLTLSKLALDSSPTMAAYETLAREAEGVLDRHHWLTQPECFAPGEIVRQLRATAAAIVEEFDKIVRIRRSSEEKIGRCAQELDAFLVRSRAEDLKTVDQHVAALAQLRARRGEIISLRELRYGDLPRLQAMEERVVARYDELSQRTVEFLLQPDALAPFAAALATLTASIEQLAKVAESPPLQEQLDKLGTEVDLISEIVSNLKIDDSTARTLILESLSALYAQLNRTKALLASRRKELLGREQTAEFGAQFKLLGQSVANYIGLCDTPEKCDELLGRLLVQVEELDARFSEFAEFIEKLAERREEIYNAFTTRKRTLLDERDKRATALASAAYRVLKNVAARAQTFAKPDELNSYFASDPMVLKVSDFIARLRELRDNVRAEEVANRLKSAREEAGRLLRDKADLFEDGANVIRLGEHRFSVNTEPLDLTLALRDGRMCFHISGTDYWDPVRDEEFLKTQEFWEQSLPTENAEVYRGEYLAWRILEDAEAGAKGLSLEKLETAAADPSGLMDVVRGYASELYDEGYERGIHDADAAAILRQAVQLRRACGLLRYDGTSRAYAAIFWSRLADAPRCETLTRRAQSFGRMERLFNSDTGAVTFVRELAGEMERFFAEAKLEAAACRWDRAAEYLFQELAAENPQGFAVSRPAHELRQQFLAFLGEHRSRAQFEADLKHLDCNLPAAFDLCRAWLCNFLSERDGAAGEACADEAIALLLTHGRLKHSNVTTDPTARVEGLLGQHRRIENRALALRLDEFLLRVSIFAAETLPRFHAYQARRKDILHAERDRLRLDEFRPHAMSTFVRNKLIDGVYLPLVGGNLAKQIGEAGAKKRTDLLGLLLVISPPGYGKTTLMEYVASRLGLIFVKINGPALGTGVTSLDPAEAPNATAREEVEKLNLALAMGNNVMIYVDDIQHTNPEFLQKFISLCDAQRKIEGVYKGRTRTYDFRGKRVVVVMAGNPYTESGARFVIPDMLANRADTYNLGDIIGGRQDLFELSYLENCMTSSPTLNPLATRAPEDFYRLVEMADTGLNAETELSHEYSSVELKDMLEVIRKLRQVQKVVLRVNQEYIRSASQKDEFRTEPPFKLQGSYRNMNKVAAKVVPVLTDAELENVVADHYRSEAHALASGAEHNLLKLAEIRGQLAEAERARWDDIKRAYNRHQLLQGADKGDKTAHIIAQLTSFNDNLDRIRTTIAAAAKRPDEGELEQTLQTSLGALNETMAKLALAQQTELAGAIAKVGEALGQEKAPPKVEIVNTLPAQYVNVYKHHVDTIETVLVPLVQGLAQQQRISEQVQVTLNQIAENLHGVIEELGHQKRRDVRVLRVEKRPPSSPGPGP
jgi:uncharacterized membrane-anchored protein YhcB (DUF1043 family)